MKNPLTRYIFQNQFLATLLFLLVAWAIIQLREVLVLIFISYILMAALYPTVEFFKKRKVPNTIAVFFTYIITVALLAILVFPLIPFFVSQIQLLFESFPQYINDSAKLLNINIDSNQFKALFAEELASVGKNVFSVTSRVFGGLFSVLTVIVVSFYLMLDYERIKKSVVLIFPKNDQGKALLIIERVQEKIGAWLRGQLILSIFIGGITWIALTLLGLSFALPLALIAGILEIVPTIGPIVSAVPAIIVALSISPTMALVVAGLYLGIQLVENNLLVPKIMQKAVGLNPIIVILMVITGAKIMGIMGALLAIPFASMLIVITRNIKHNN
ncbi:AI-2E family transporter [Patescibacteria group bacterium]|nr:AI-2E family transporter [Patescibacteria group bacterium]